MAAFPALQPSARTWTPGGFGISTMQALSGAQIRISHSSQQSGDVLALVFANRSESDSLLITTHFAGQGGTRDAFSLPNAAYAGLQSFSTVAGANQWIYRSAPKVEHNSSDIHTITVELEKVLR
jgi:hypothetical protein